MNTETLGTILERGASVLYKTAQARIGCAKFPIGAYVSVRFSHRNSDGVTWYEIAETQFGKLDSPVMYPAHHLTNFCL